MVIEGWLEPERVVVASAGSGRSPTVSGSVTASKKPPLPFAPEPPPSVLEAPNPPEPAPPAAEPLPVVVVDAPPGAPVLDALHVSVALPAPVAAVGSSPHAVSATTDDPGPGEVGGGRCAVGSRPTDCGNIGAAPGHPGGS
ncbi:unnamed protein product [Closterium sp. Naga37s-1]|nr:unnamed protein product [Closterium sp. Naga37s-1]